MRRRRWLAVVVATGIVLATIPVAAQEEDLPIPLDPVPRDEVIGSFPIDDGEYRGSVGLGGVFWFFDEASGALVIWDGEGTGPMEFTVSDGELSGSWEMAGAAEILGYGFPFSLSGTNSWTMNGSVSGSDPYRLRGSGSSTSTVSAAGQAQTTTSPIDGIDVPLQGILQVCDQVVGNWDHAVDAAFEGAPLQHELRTYFAVFATEDSDELETRVDELLEGAAAIQSDLSIPFLVTRDLSLLLDQAEDLLSDIEAHPDGCPPDDQAFMRVITQLVADVMNTFLERWSGEPPDRFQAQDLQRMVSVGLRAGAIGSGAADPGSARYLQAKAEQVLQRQFDAAAGQDPIDETGLTHAALTATMLGYTFDSGMTGSDVCIMLGSC